MHFPKSLSDQLFKYDFPQLLAALHPYEPDLMRTSFKPLDRWATKFSSKAHWSEDQLQRDMIEFRGFLLLFLHSIKDKSAELKENLDERYPLQANPTQDILIQVNNDSKEATNLNSSQMIEEEFAKITPICPICKKSFQKTRTGLWVCPPCRFYLEYIELGQILDSYLHEASLLKISDFKKHSLILGGTGAGKSNTGLWIAYQLREAGVPVWVFECEGTQWRNFTQMKLRNPKAAEKVLIFTIQNILLNIFRMNPLEPPPGVTLESHIANFVQNFAFTYDLEDWATDKIRAAITIHLLRKGWNIPQNKCTGKEGEYHYPLPVELLEEIGEVLKEYFMYRQEFQAHLGTRLRDFNMWSLAYTWNTRKSVPWEELLSSNVVFELHEMNNASKQFFVLTMLTMVLEYAAALGEIGSSEPPRLVIIIEEAGDLLTQEAHGENKTSVSTQTQKIIEKMFSQARKLGVGLVVMDQTPERLPPRVQALPQTGIIHNLTNKGSLEQVINIFRNLDYIPRLEIGEVMCVSPQKGSAKKVKVHQFPYRTVTDTEIQTYMNSFYETHPWFKQTDPDIEEKIYAAMIYSKSGTERDPTELVQYEPFLMGLTQEDIDISTEITTSKVTPSEIDLFCARIELNIFSSVPTLKTYLSQFRNVYSVTEDLRNILRIKYEQPLTRQTILNLQTQISQTGLSGIHLKQTLGSLFPSILQLAPITQSYPGDFSATVYSLRLLVFKHLKFTNKERIIIYMKLLRLLVELLIHNTNTEVR